MGALRRQFKSTAAIKNAEWAVWAKDRIGTPKDTFKSPNNRRYSRGFRP